MKTSFSISIMGSYTSENNCSCQWRRESTGHMYDISGLAWLASDGSPLFAVPMFLFGWALCNTSTGKLRTEFTSPIAKSTTPGLSDTTFFARCHRLLQYIFTYALFWQPRVNLSHKKQLPYHTIPFSWNNRSVEQSSYAMSVPLTLIYFFFFAKVTTLFLKWKRISLLSE